MEWLTVDRLLSASGVLLSATGLVFSLLAWLAVRHLAKRIAFWRQADDVLRELNRLASAVNRAAATVAESHRDVSNAMARIEGIVSHYQAAWPRQARRYARQASASYLRFRSLSEQATPDIGELSTELDRYYLALSSLLANLKEGRRTQAEIPSNAV